MVLWMELLVGAPHQASAVYLWVGAGVRERVFACFLAHVRLNRSTRKPIWGSSEYGTGIADGTVGGSTWARSAM
jgi:hypothetical protein